jgi:hypothetical protein
MPAKNYPPEFSFLLSGKSDYSLELYDHFITEFEKLGTIHMEATKSMIGISNSQKRIAWITQIGKNFIHVVFPFSEAHENLCFQKVAQVPGSKQFNHHFRMLYKEDLNQEVIGFMKRALRGR